MRILPWSFALMVSRMSLLWRILGLGLVFATTAWAEAAPGTVTPDPPTWLPRAPQTVLRVLSWNVERAFIERNAGFQRVLRAIDADVLILDEMAPGLSAERIVAAMPPHPQPWQAVYGSGGGPHQRASIVSTHALHHLPAFDHLAYPEARYEAWLSIVPAQAQARARATLDAGVAAVGALVELDGRRLLVVGLDLQCCGTTADGVEEERRRFEARAIRTAIDDIARTTALDAIVVGGDFNAVQGPAPVDLLRQAPEAAHELAAVEAGHRGHAVDWTWSGEGTPFPSSRLDFILHSNALVPLQAQVFDSEDLDHATRKAMGIDTRTSQALSPHRPVVVDFDWRAPPASR